jgi:hypothetical protein
VPDDRFADLGSGTRAGDRLRELDENEPPRRPDPPRRGRYNWVIGVAVVIAIGAAGLNALPNAGRGYHGPAVGKPLPHFAAPSATSSADGDPNIKQRTGDRTANKTAACDVRVPGALRLCDYTSKPLVLTFIVPTQACEDYLDRVDRIRARFPGVNFLAVVSAPTKRARALVASRHWGQPVAVDRNGALLTLYRVGICVTQVFAYRGGIVRATQIKAQDWSDAQLAAAVTATERR